MTRTATKIQIPETIITEAYLKGLLDQLEAAGGRFQIDGYDIKLFGKSIPADLIAELRKVKYPLIHALVRHIANPCFVCLGAPAVSDGERFFCSGHAPTTPDRKRLVELAAQRSEVFKEALESGDLSELTERYNALCDQFDALAERITKEEKAA